MCVTGLALSIVVHGLLFDLFRKPSGEHSSEPAKPLKLRLARTEIQASPRNVPAQAEFAAVRQTVLKQTPAPARGIPEPFLESKPLSLERAADSRETPFAGFRPMSVDEGKIAYRLALFAAMSSGWPELPGAPLKLQLAFGAGGQLSVSRVLQGSGDAAADLAWQRLIGGAVEQAALPEVLAARSFMLELEILN